VSSLPGGNPSRSIVDPDEPHFGVCQLTPRRELALLTLAPIELDSRLSPEASTIVAVANLHVRFYLLERDTGCLAVAVPARDEAGRRLAGRSVEVDRVAELYADPDAILIHVILQG